MTMTTRKRTPDTSTVTVKVVEPHLVFHDGEQRAGTRAGTLTGVPAATAKYWVKHGWVTINDEPAPTGDE